MDGIWVCAGCGCRYAAGAPRCPECPETKHTEAEADEMLKITRDGSVSDSAAIVAGDGEPEVTDAPEAVAEAPEPAAEPEPAAPETEAVPAPATPPRTPPRRPPAAPGD